MLELFWIVPWTLVVSIGEPDGLWEILFWLTGKKDECLCVVESEKE